jgi:hypothetical protein
MSYDDASPRMAVFVKALHREITQIFQIFELLPEGVETRKERIERLRETARGEGLV